MHGFEEAGGARSGRASKNHERRPAATVGRWAVRQISGLLSDYLEGITEQNLQASFRLVENMLKPFF